MLRISRLKQTEEMDSRKIETLKAQEEGQEDPFSLLLCISGEMDYILSTAGTDTTEEEVALAGG